METVYFIERSTQRNTGDESRMNSYDRMCRSEERMTNVERKVAPFTEQNIKASRQSRVRECAGGVGTKKKRRNKLAKCKHEEKPDRGRIK